MLVDNHDARPDAEEQRPSDLAAVESPRNVRHIVEKNIGKRGISLHVWHSFVHDDHHKRSYPCHQECVTCAKRKNGL